MSLTEKSYVRDADTIARCRDLVDLFTREKRRLTDALIAAHERGDDAAFEHADARLTRVMETLADAMREGEEATRRWNLPSFEAHLRIRR